MLTSVASASRRKLLLPPTSFQNKPHAFNESALARQHPFVARYKQDEKGRGFLVTVNERYSHRFRGRETSAEIGREALIFVGFLGPY